MAMDPLMDQRISRLEGSSEHMATKAEVAQLEVRMGDRLASLEARLTWAFIGLIVTAIVAISSVGMLVLELTQ